MFQLSHGRAVRFLRDWNLHARTVLCPRKYALWRIFTQG